jgi:hypothetical protein
LFKGILERAFFSFPESQAKRMKMIAKTEKILNMMRIMELKIRKNKFSIHFVPFHCVAACAVLDQNEPKNQG